MQTLHSRFPLARQTVDPFRFAGLLFPRYLSVLPPFPPIDRDGRPTRERLERYTHPHTAGYYTAPHPRPTKAEGFGCYLEEDRCSGLRFEWADEVEGVLIKHTGWYTDEHGVAETMRGIVLILPRSRGFLAGWSMGKGMATSVDYEIHETKKDAAYAADNIAELAAEREREYQANNREEEEDETA